MAAGPAALSFAACLCPEQTDAEVRAATGSSGRSDPRSFARQSWAQEWENTFPLLGLPENSGVDVTALLKAKNLDPKGMVKYGENFFISMGFAPLPQTFWERSLFVKPRDRDVVCHASAWDIDNKDDLR